MPQHHGHGWVPVIDTTSLTPAGLKSPFGRLFPAADITYNSNAISLLAGALGPLHKLSKPDDAPQVKGTNPTGTTFLGQFVDHDMTEFRVLGPEYALILQNPTIGQRQLVLEDRRIEGQYPTSTNGRTGRLDLDSVYGLLGVAQPNLYDENGMFLMTNDQKDILRGTAYNDGRLIADLRNDENKILVQLHILFERLHNKIHAAKSGTTRQKGAGGDLFNETKAQVQKIYRNILIFDHIPRLVLPIQMKQVANALKHNRTCYQKMIMRNRLALIKLGVPEDEVKDAVAVPVEFSHAAYRLGHSQLRNGYQLNADNGFPLFNTGESLINDGQPTKDLRGKQALTPEFFIDWSFFFHLNDNDSTKPHQGLPIDGKLAESIFRLPPPAIDAPPLSLAERNIRRGVDFGLPSGQECAAILTETYGNVPATAYDAIFPKFLTDKYKEILDIDPTLSWRTPLWYYILREAESLVPGSQLGPVGGYIVAETLLGSLAETPEYGIDLVISQINQLTDNPDDLPFDVPSDINDIKTMGQMINFINS